MRDQILNALKAKFPGVNANVLNRIADKLAKTVTTQEQLTTAVAGVTQEFIEIIESYGDSRATEAQQTAVHNYETRYGLKDGQKVDQAGGAGSAGGQAGGTTVQQQAGGAGSAGGQAGGTTVQQQAGGAPDQIPAWAQALIDSNKAMTERINKMDSERTTATRRQQIQTIIAKLPEDLRKGYERTPVDNLTDEQFNTLVGEITTEVDGIANTLNAKGAVFGKPSAQGGTGNQGNELSKEQLDNIARRDGASKEGQPF